MIGISTLIINGDDFGFAESSTKAITEAFRKNIITSSTICANGEYFDEAVKAIFENDLHDKIGLHLNITEGKPLTSEISKDAFFCLENGLFHGKIDRKKTLTTGQKQNVYDELTAQLNRTIENGIRITHIDSHHHIHTATNMTHTFLKFMKNNNIGKLRISRNIGEIPFIKKTEKKIFNKYLHVCGFKTTELFGGINDLKHVKDSGKSLEIMVHPDFNKNGELIDRKDIDSMNNPIGNILKFDDDFLKKYSLCAYSDGV